MDLPLTIKETQKGLIEKKYSVVDLVDAYLARINKFNSEINALITISDETAYSQAKWADKLAKRGGKDVFKQHPLLGVTVIHKDMFLTKGVRTTAGSSVLKSFVPTYSATVVERLEKAGCIMLGKANHDAWAHGSSGENSDFGPTKNPWSKSFVPGGSSSGSGAALAANFSLITTGTDTCGSVRLPANYCGVFGLKPTYGAVSRYGIVAMASSLDTVGHFCRTSEDLEKVFNITKGEDNKDSNVKNTKHIKKNKKLVIGLPREFFVKGVDKEVENTVRKAANIFGKSGIEIIDISLPHTKYGVSVYYIIQPAEVSSNLGRYDGIRYGNDRSTFGDEAKRRIMLGTYVLSAGYYDAYYLKAMKVRSIIIKEVDNAFKKVNAIIAPVAPSPPFKLGEKADDPLKMYLTDIYAATANLSGIPSIAIPYGFSKKGLPLGFQLMGPRFSENSLFKMAKMFEKEISYKPKFALN
jgi:aspartyl-tRNA(Asn)/glutamyl-tRNA(Gln) amidotransferase subunit A